MRELPDDIAASLAQLPRWARVAFAVRCARRVQCMYHGRHTHLDEKLLYWAVEYADRACRQASENVAQTAVSRAMRAALHFLVPRGTIAEAIGRPPPATVERLAEEAASVAVHCANTTKNGNKALEAAQTSILAADLSDRLEEEHLRTADASARVSQAIRDDLDTLTKLARENGWDDGACVAPDAAGELWPADEPSWWFMPVLERDPGEQVVLIGPHTKPSRNRRPRLVPMGTGTGHPSPASAGEIKSDSPSPKGDDVAMHRAQGTSAHAKEGPWWLAHVGVFFGLLGVALYGILWMFYAAVYSSFGVSPEEVGITYIQVVRTAGGTLVIGAILNGITWLLPFWRLREPERRRTYLRRLRVSIPVVLLAWLLATATNEGFSFVENVRRGEASSPAPASSLCLRATRARPTWLSDTLRARFGERSTLLYLGSSDGTTVLYDYERSEAVRIPSADIALELLPSDSKFDMPPQGDTNRVPAPDPGK